MWVSTRVILMAEPSTGDIFAFFYTRDISEQKKSEQITKLTLEKNCDYIALLNVMKRTMNYRSISKEEEKFGEKAEPAEPVSVEELIEKLEKSGEFSLTYDREAPDGAVQRKQIQYRWLDDSKAEILVVQTDITAAYVQEQERTRQLQEALAAAEKANNAKTEFISRISHDPEEIVEVIHQKLKNKRIEIKGVNDSYLVTVSIGYTICDKTDKEPNAAFERADSHLYENKRKWHMNND